MPEPPATDAGAWLTLRELDDRGGAAKGTAFRAFRTALAELVEGRDFLRLDAVTDADTIATLPPLSQEDKLYFDEMAQDVEAVFASSGQSDAFERVEIEQLDNEQKLHLWSRLGSKVRAALKVEKGLRIGAA